MSALDQRPPRHPWFRLGEYVSKSSGRPYMVGFVGDLKIVILMDPAAEPPKGAVAAHVAYVEPAPRRQQATSNRPAPLAAQPAAAPSGVRQVRRNTGTDARAQKLLAERPDAGQMPNDDLPF